MKSALIAAVVSAIVAAASGTAATIVVTSKNIKNGTIQSVDLSLKAKKALRGKAGARGPAGQPGAQGPPGPQGIQGPAGIQRLRLVTALITVLPGSPQMVTATCPAGELAVSGGYGLDSADAAVLQSFGNGQGWVVVAENPLTAPANVQAYAYCSPGVGFVP